MRKYRSWVIGHCALVIALVGVAWADPSAVNFTVDGQSRSVAGCILYADGEIMAPARSAADMLGLGLTWNDALMALVVHYHGTNFTFFHEKNTCLFNGEDLALEHAPFVSHGKMMVPIGLICESIGAKMNRVSATRVAIETGRFSVRETVEPYRLTIRAEGTPYQPHTFRALPTGDQLRVSSTEVAEMFGGEVKWDPDLSGAILTIDNHILVFVQDTIDGVLDGRPFALSRKPVLSQQDLLVPLDSVCEMLTRPWQQEGPWSFSIGAPL